MLCTSFALREVASPEIASPFPNKSTIRDSDESAMNFAAHVTIFKDS
jgi:hypothetical protein